MLFVNMKDIIEFLNTYSNALTLCTSMCLLIVTGIYVFFTKKQASSSYNALQESIKQFKDAKQPCLIPNICNVSGCAFDTSDYLRIQFTFNYELQNIGDFAALSVYTIATMKLKYSSKEVVAHLMPNFHHAIAINEKHADHFHFETKAFRGILEDLEISRVKNQKRIETDPSETPYGGPILCMTILYQNMQNQWYMTSYEQELLDIAWGSDDAKITSKRDKKRICNTSLKDGDLFEGFMINPAYSNIKHIKISEYEAKTLISRYSEPISQ